MKTIKNIVTLFFFIFLVNSINCHKKPPLFKCEHNEEDEKNPLPNVVIEPSIKQKEAYKRIGHLFPKVDLPKERGGGKGTVITWMQTRTVKCPNPACQCNMPLIKSFTVVKDKKKPYYIEPIIEGRRIRYDVRSGTTKRKATVNRKGATCLFCNSPVDFEYIREDNPLPNSTTLKAYTKADFLKEVFISDEDFEDR